MGVPDFQSLMRPVLTFAQNQKEHSVKDTISGVARDLGLGLHDLEVLLASGRQTVFANRIHWSITYLDKAGALRRTKRGYYMITQRGLDLLQSHPDRVDSKILRQFAEFRDFQSARSTDDDANPIPAASNPPLHLDIPAKTPEEAIQSAEDALAESLRGQLLARIAELPPAFFERLVVDLIVAMGYGGNRQSVARRIGKSGDEGIDGVVNEDPLGLDTVYIQAKRYALESTVGRERIQQFAGALVGQSASKGVFVTTSSYSRGAIEYAQKVPQRIVLLDGNELARLMMQYGVGVRTERTVELKRIDLEYFEGGEE
jgi:restriction system protein